MDLLLSNPQQYRQESINIEFCQHLDFVSSIPQFFSLFTEEDFFADVDIKLRCRENSEVVNGVLDGSIDLGFILSDTNIANPNIKLSTVVSSEPQIYFSVNCPLSRKSRILFEDFSDYPLVTTKYLIDKNDYRMINLLPFTPKRIEIVDSYDDILIYLATGRYITLLRPYVNLAGNKNIISHKLPDNYNLTQGITMIWFRSNKNKYLKKILSRMVSNESNG